LLIELWDQQGEESDGSCVPMNKMLLLLGSSALMLGVTIHSAEARKVYYEINGKRYSYSTNNRAQTAEARKRIEAARVAEAAKAKAEAERSTNPLTAAFGSPVQREASEAEGRLQQVLAGGEVVEAPATSLERRAARRSSGTSKADAAPQRTAALVQEPSRQARMPVTAPSPIAEPVRLPDRPGKVKSISFDVETGIKTTIMVDGTVEEEPFDSSMLSHLAPDHGATNSLTAFVKQLRQTTPSSSEEATGSIARTPDRPPRTEAAAQPPLER